MVPLNPMRIVLLGTSSAIPTLTRGLSATALVREGDVFLFDCGEGTQLQLMRSTVKRSRIHSIFIGHLHGDHLYGIAGLLSTLHLDGRVDRWVEQRGARILMLGELEIAPLILLVARLGHRDQRPAGVAGSASTCTHHGASASKPPPSTTLQA